MARLVGTLLALALLLPTAAAAPGAPELPDATRLREAAANAGSAVADAGHAAADAAGTAASAVGSAVAAVAHGIASAAQAIGHFIASAASAIGSALLGAGSGLARGVAAFASFLAALALDGFAFVRAHPKESAIAAGSATSLGLVAWLAKRFGWLTSLIPLYTRLAPSQMLDNEARARVYAHVRERPGAHPSGIAEALDLGWGTVVYHLSRLEESKLVTCRTAGHRKCYFAVGTEMGADARAAVAAMSHDKAKLIVSVVREAPGITQKDLAQRVGMSQALASWHVKRLVTSGVLRTTREGRSNMLHVAEHVPDLAPAAAPVAVAA